MSENNFEAKPHSKLRFETTVNIDRGTYSKLNEASEKYGVSKSRLIGLLIELFVQREETPECTVGTVKYQQTQPKENWKQLHIVIPGYACDFFDDIRKLWKCSVSFLVVLAVKKYLAHLDEIFTKGFTDNYWSGAYTSILFEHNNMQFLLFCWGVPQEKPEILLE